MNTPPPCEILLMRSIGLEHMWEIDTQSRLTLKRRAQLTTRVSGSTVNVAIGLHRIFGRSVGVAALVARDQSDPAASYLLNEAGRQLEFPIFPLRYGDKTFVSSITIDPDPRREWPVLQSKDECTDIPSATADITELCARVHPSVRIATGVTSNDAKLINAMFARSDPGSALNVLIPGIDLLLKPAILEEVLPSVDILFINHEELGAYLGKSMGPEYLSLQTVMPLHRQGVRIVAITRSWSGATVSSVRDSAWHSLPTREFGEAVSTVGAGDAFAAGFMGAYLQRKTLKECLQSGIVLAGLKVTLPGGPVFPTAEEFKKALNS